MNSDFSKRVMVQREAMVHEKINVFTRLRDLEVVDFDAAFAAFAALTADMIYHTCTSFMGGTLAS